MRRLLVNRGLPGSGKSTRAARLACQYIGQGIEVVICSSDDYFVCPCCQAYNFDRERLRHAHSWCQRKCDQAMERGVPIIIIDNTNLTYRECRPYVLLAQQHDYEVQFLEPATPWAFDLDELFRRNLHRVPRHGLERMLRRWVPDMTVEKALAPSQPGEPTPDEEAACEERSVTLGTTARPEDATPDRPFLSGAGDNGQRPDGHADPHHRCGPQ